MEETLSRLTSEKQTVGECYCGAIQTCSILNKKIKNVHVVYSDVGNADLITTTSAMFNAVHS